MAVRLITTTKCSHLNTTHTHTAFKDGKRTGTGTYTWAATGNKYAGEWQDDRRNVCTSLHIALTAINNTSFRALARWSTRTGTRGAACGCLTSRHTCRYCDVFIALFCTPCNVQYTCHTSALLRWRREATPHHERRHATCAPVRIASQ